MTTLGLAVGTTDTSFVFARSGIRFLRVSIRFDSGGIRSSHIPGCTSRGGKGLQTIDTGFTFIDDTRRYNIFIITCRYIRV